MRIISSLIRIFFIETSLDAFLGKVEINLRTPEQNGYPRTLDGLLLAMDDRKYCLARGIYLNRHKIEEYISRIGFEATLKALDGITTSTCLHSEFLSMD